MRYQVGLGSFNDDKSFFNVACGFVCKQYGRMRGQKREARRVEGLELEV